MSSSRKSSRSSTLKSQSPPKRSSVYVDVNDSAAAETASVDLNGPAPVDHAPHSPGYSPIHSTSMLPSTAQTGFVPRPYTFKIKGEEVGPDGAVARMPPYWMLMDHTLAVIWCICSPKHTDMVLGITQLQWALYMLKSVKTRRGDYTVDVKHLIDTIEDRLLDQYAAIAKNSHGLLDGNKNKSINTSTHSTSQHSTRLRPEKISKKCSVQKKLELASGSPDVELSSIALDGSSAYDTAQDNTQSTGYDTANDFTPLTSVAPPKLESNSQSSRLDDFEAFLKMRKDLFLSNTDQARPASAEYEEIMKRAPPSSGLKPMITPSSPFVKRQLFLDDDKMEDDNEKLMGDINAKLPASVSKADTIIFLKQMRREQVARIRNEMTRLRGIEEFMKQVDTENFRPLLDMSLTRRLEEIDLHSSLEKI